MNAKDGSDDANNGVATHPLPIAGQFSSDTKISVLLPNYNHGAMIRQSVQAIVDQTYTEWEMIIVDDGSSDDSPDVIRLLSEADDRIKPIFFGENRGAMAAVDCGFSYLTGDLFIAIAADDFLVDPTFFASVIAELAARPTAAGVFGRCRVVDATDLRELWTMGSAPAGGPCSAVASLQAFFDNTIFVPGASAVWRLPLVRAAGGFDAALGPQADYYLNHALPAMADGVIFLDRIVAAVRTAPKGYSRSASDDEFLRRHALVEVRLRALPAISGVDPAAIRRWRFAILNARLNLTLQRHFFRTVWETSDAVAPWMRDSTSPEFLSMLESVGAQCAGLAAELERRAAAAMAIFDTVAGPLGVDDPGDQA